MDEIHVFCMHAGISYFLIGGTLLGAVRHRGFIPWDDDMDIGLLRADYNRLLGEFKSKSGSVKILSSDSTKHYKWPQAKAVHTKTKLIELGDEKNQIGIFVDIFPLDYIVGSYEQATRIVKRSNFWKNLLTIKYLKTNPNRSTIKNLIIILGKLFKVIPDRFLINKVNRYGTKKTREKGDYLCNFSGAWGIREIASAEQFDARQLCRFEDRMYYIPLGFDAYLHTVYGDYMMPPPVEKRVSHHANQAFWIDDSRNTNEDAY